MKVWSLSSGSSGNCYLLRERGRTLVLEAGLGVRRVERELVHLGISRSEIAGVLVSHDHTDHCSSAAALARGFQAPLLCTPGTMRAIGLSPDLVAYEPLMPGRRVTLGPFAIDPFALPHDAEEPVGFCVSAEGSTICLATDMGTMPSEVVERARKAQLVILEANHDVEMLARGPYPASLKARILGDRGHLSNDAAASTIVRIAEGKASPPSFWLAHLSHTNNSPRVAMRSIRAKLRRHGLEGVQVAVALRDRRSLSWDSSQAFAQLRLL